MLASVAQSLTELAASAPVVRSGMVVTKRVARLEAFGVVRPSDTDSPPLARRASSFPWSWTKRVLEATSLNALCRTWKALSVLCPTSDCRYGSPSPELGHTVALENVPPQPPCAPWQRSAPLMSSARPRV